MVFSADILLLRTELISERRAHSSSRDIELKSSRFIVLTLLRLTISVLNGRLIVGAGRCIAP
jgi:hypothetical protein